MSSQMADAAAEHADQNKASSDISVLEPPKKARLAFLTIPEGRPIINLQADENSPLLKFEISSGQLAGMVLEGTRYLLIERNLNSGTHGDGE